MVFGLFDVILGGVFFTFVVVLFVLLIEQEPGVIYLHEMTTCLLGIF